MESRSGHRSRGLLMSAKASSQTLKHKLNTQLGPSVSLHTCVCVILLYKFGMKTNSQEVLEDGCHSHFHRLYTLNHTHTTHD